MGRECPECGSRDIEEREDRGFIFTDIYFICMDCGYTFG